MHELWKAKKGFIHLCSSPHKKKSTIKSTPRSLASYARNRRAGGRKGHSGMYKVNVPFPFPFPFHSAQYIIVVPFKPQFCLFTTAATACVSRTSIEVELADGTAAGDAEKGGGSRDGGGAPSLACALAPPLFLVVFLLSPRS